MRGRKPLPTDVKRARGNPGHGRLNDAEPRPSVTEALFVQLPAELDGDDGARQYWLQLVPVLRLARQITDADRPLMIALCLEQSLYHEATRRARETALLTKTKGGAVVQNPYLAISRRALMFCAKLWAELGMTPSSRSRVTTSSLGRDDPWAEFADVPPTRAALLDDDDDGDEATH